MMDGEMYTLMAIPQTYERIVRVDLKFPAHVSMEARDLIRKVGPAVMINIPFRLHRVPPVAVLWVSQRCRLCGVHRDVCHFQMLRRDPAKRLQLNLVASHPWVMSHVKRTAAVLTTAKTMSAPIAGPATVATVPQDVL
jgi:hypothetical protein